jgi:hypothetical protein
VHGPPGAQVVAARCNHFIYETASVGGLVTLGRPFDAISRPAQQLQNLLVLVHHLFQRLKAEPLGENGVERDG